MVHSLEFERARLLHAMAARSIGLFSDALLDKAAEFERITHATRDGFLLDWAAPRVEECLSDAVLYESVRLSMLRLARVVRSNEPL